MGTVSSLYDLSRSALLADQQALDATSANVANQNTTGYTRQIVSFAPRDTIVLGGTVQGGAPEATVTSARNRVLEQRLQQATQGQSATAARASVLASVQDVFDVSGSAGTAGSTAIGTALDGLFSSLSSLSVAPADAATQGAAQTAVKTLAGAFNAAATQLSGVQTSLRAGLTSAVTEVNGLTTTIAGLNAEIAQVSPDADAGALEDQRQSAIAQLSQYIGLDQIKTENNGIALTTSGGVALVSGTSALPLTAVAVGLTTEVRDGSGTDIAAAITGGSLGGQLTAQSVDLPAVAGALDTLAYNVATALNTANAAGYNADGSAGAPLLLVGATSQGAAGAISFTGASIASAGAGEGSSGNTNALALAALANKTDGTGETFSGQLAALLSQVGSSSAALTAQSASESATVTQLTTQRDSDSAVSLDEEASNLSVYQRGYDAAAKLFSIADSLAVTALNLGTQTAIS